MLKKIKLIKLTLFDKYINNITIYYNFINKKNIDKNYSLLFFIS